MASNQKGFRNYEAGFPFQLIIILYKLHKFVLKILKIKQSFHPKLFFLKVTQSISFVLSSLLVQADNELLGKSM